MREKNEVHRSVRMAVESYTMQRFGKMEDGTAVEFIEIIEKACETLLDQYQTAFTEAVISHAVNWGHETREHDFDQETQRRLRTMSSQIGAELLTTVSKRFRDIGAEKTISKCVAQVFRAESEAYVEHATAMWEKAQHKAAQQGVDPKYHPEFIVDEMEKKQIETLDEFKERRKIAKSENQGGD